jgi:hypothetical protein
LIPNRQKERVGGRERGKGGGGRERKKKKEEEEKGRKGEEKEEKKRQTNELDEVYSIHRCSLFCYSLCLTCFYK